MPSCMKKQVRRYFDAAAQEYENAALIQQQIARDMIRKLAATWPDICGRSDAAGESPLPACDTVLEIGAGVGTLTREILPELHCRTYLAADVAGSMLAHLRAQTGDNRLAPFVADGEAMPLPRHSIDLLLSSSAMQWYQNPERSITANLDLIRPGGRFALNMFVDGTLAELAETSRKTGFGSIHPLAGAERILKIFTAYPGLTFVHTQRVDRLGQPDALSLLHSLRRTGARYTAGKKAASPRRLAAFRREYEKNYAGPDGVYVSYKSLCIMGRKAPADDRNHTAGSLEKTL